MNNAHKIRFVGPNLNLQDPNEEAGVVYQKGDIVHHDRQDVNIRITGPALHEWNGRVCSTTYPAEVVREPLDPLMTVGRD